MALAFDPIRTFFRGIKQVQTNTYPFIEKERGKGIKERIQKEAGKYIYIFLTNTSKMIF